MIDLRVLALWCVLSLLVLPTRAQDDTTDVAFRVQLADSVVVTASRTASAIQVTGRRVSVYTRRDIEALSVTTLDQLLDVVAGVDAQSRGGFGIQSDLTMRGSTFNGVLLLIDGARLNDPMTGHFLMDLPVPMSEIARVEVLRGPATALYGPDALGGVVHLITKTALRTGKRTDSGVAAQVDGQYGKNNLHDASGSGRVVGTNTTASVAATTQGSDGQTVRTVDGNPIPSGRGDNVHTDFGRRAGTAAVSHNLGDATVYARAGVDDRNFSAWHYYTPFESDKARESTSTYWTQVRASNDASAEATNWRVQVSGKQHDDRYTFNVDADPNTHTSRMLNVHGQVSHTLRSVLLTAGSSFQVRGIDSNTYGLHTDFLRGAFLSLRWSATPRLTVNQSTRVDYDPLYGVEATPQLYAAYNLDFVTLRAGGGRAVRAPNYVERFIDTPRNQGNPDLDAEKAWSGEVGIDAQLPFQMGLHATGFVRNTRELIDYLLEENVFHARNLDSRTRGLELEATLDRHIRAGQLHLRSGYTFLDSEFDVTPVSDYKYAPTTLRHLVQGSASITVGSTTLGLQGLWRDRIVRTGLETGSYAVFHGRIGQTIRVGTRRASLSAEVRNLFDRQYSEIFDAPMPGRWWIIGAEVQL